MTEVRYVKFELDKESLQRTYKRKTSVCCKIMIVLSLLLFTTLFILWTGLYKEVCSCMDVDYEYDEKSVLGSVEPIDQENDAIKGLDGIGDPKVENDNPKRLRIRRSTNTKPETYDNIWFDAYASSTCKLPKDLKTVDIRCKMWPNTIACNSYCVYGSTYKEGIMRKHICHHKQNKWSENFEECKPFVDCKVKIVSPGNLKCFENQVFESPSCQISCEEYEKQDRTDKITYYCKSDGTWDPPLPHCVDLKGTFLVTAPKITEHVDISYPEE